MHGIDIAPGFVRHAAQAGGGIGYAVASAQALPFPGGAFDFATAFMSLMDMPAPEQALRETARVLKPGGWIQFSISHPCFDTRHRRKVRNARGREVAVEVGGYFEKTPVWIDEWLFSAAPGEAKANLPKFRMPKFHWTLAEWLNMVAASGMNVEQAAEPHASPEVAARRPKLAATRLVPYFLHLRCRKLDSSPAAD